MPTKTRWCPNCGEEYQGMIPRCLDCDVDLVDEPPVGVDESDDGGGADTPERTDLERPEAERSANGEQVSYELHDWSYESRALLEQLLSAAGVARAWEAATLVVDQSYESVVDEIIDEVDASHEAALDPGAEKTVYEVNDWTVDQLTVLTSALGEAAIPYEFDIDGDLAVLVEDEPRVEELLDRLEFGAPETAVEDTGGDPEDGVETVGMLSDLFVACDRLHNDPRDADGILGAVAGADRLAGRRLPFGYEPSVWNSMLGQAGDLKAMLEDDTVEDDDIIVVATRLRALLFQYV